MTNNADSATPSQPSQDGAQLATLHRYLRALDRGDAATVAAILRAAGTDAALERMIFTANSAYLDQEYPEPTRLGERETPSPDGEAVWTAVPYLEAPVLPAPAMSRPVAGARPAVLRWTSTLAAALVVSLLLGSYFLLFASHGAPDSSRSVTVGSPVPYSATATTPADPFIVAGTQNGYVIALRTDTGAVVWRWGGDQIVENLVSSGDVVYVTSYSASLSASNAPAVLTALRMSDGSKLWQRTEPQLQGYSTYMAVDGGALVVAARDGNDTVYGFDAHSGRLQWTYPGNGFRQGLLITATGGIAYIDGINRGFIALDDQTGKRLWTYDKGNEPAITTGPNGPTIVAGSGGLVYYYEEEAWPIPLSTPSIVTFEAATDTIRETLTWDQTGDPLLVTPDGTAYTDQNNRLCALHIAGAAPLWCTSAIDVGVALSLNLRLAGAANVLCYSQIANNGVIADNGNPLVVGALDNTTGMPLWAWQSPASASMSLAGDKDRLYLATSEGLYAFQASTGKLLWHALATTSLSNNDIAIEPVLAG